MIRLDKTHWLYTTPIAHRGLWNSDIVENSLQAYKRASDLGFAIEIDVYSSIDGEIFSFHDKSLYRLTGENGLIYQKTSEEINKLCISKNGDKIPTLKETLFTLDGKVPLLIEIKNQPDKKIVNRIVDILNDYKGDFAIQSFNPLYIKKVKRLAPHFICGILTTTENNFLKNEKKLNAFIVKKMPLNFLVKPDFISVSYKSKPLKKRYINKPVLAWTITDIKDYKSKSYDNFIFEGFIPNNVEKG